MKERIPWSVRIPVAIEAAVNAVLANGGKNGRRPELWTGRQHTAIAAV